MRYIQEDLTITPYEIPGITWPLSDELAAKLDSFGPFSSLIFDGGELVDIIEDTVTREAYEASQIPTEEDLLQKKIERMRQDRTVLLSAFDIYKTNLAYGIIEETDEEHAEIVAWYQNILNITESASIEYKIEWPETPPKIAKYLPSYVKLTAV